MASLGVVNVLSITTKEESKYYILMNLMLQVSSIYKTGGPDLSYSAGSSYSSLLIIPTFNYYVGSKLN